MIILGIDPGYAIVGFGVIEKSRIQTTVIDYGVIETDKSLKMSTRLNKIYDGIEYLIKKYKPDCFAMEELFYHTNQKTVINVAMARGVILLSAVKNLGEEKLFEYTPLQIKQALTGNGRAEKQQIQYMVKAILNLSKVPKPDDAADALAVALCHSQTNTFLSNTQIK